MVEFSSQQISQELRPSFFKDPNPFLIATGHFGHGRFPCAFVGSPIDERIPKCRSTNGETNESRNWRGDSEPFPDLFVVFTST